MFNSFTFHFHRNIIHISTSFSALLLPPSGSDEINGGVVPACDCMNDESDGPVLRECQLQGYNV